MTKRLGTASSFIAIALAVASCGGDDSGGLASTTTTTPSGFVVYGYAHSGPTCPVVITPPDPTCDDRPVFAAVIVVRDAAGATVAEIGTRADGTFAVTLPPGSYTFVPQPVEGLMVTAAEVEVIVVDGPVADIDVAYDTGIR